MKGNLFGVIKNFRLTRRKKYLVLSYLMHFFINIIAGVHIVLIEKNMRIRSESCQNIGEKDKKWKKDEKDEFSLYFRKRGGAKSSNFCKYTIQP